MKRKSLKVLLGLSMAICFMAAGVKMVSANNYRDTNWTFTLGRLQTNSYTSSRQKTDATSAYAKLKIIGKGGVNVWLQMSNGKEVGSPKVNLRKKGAYSYITNYAYEKYGKSNVRLAVESNYLNPVQINAAGVWSPDSI